MHKNGILFLKETLDKGTVLEHTIRELYLPIFYEDREFVNSVLIDAMNAWKLLETKRSYRSLEDFFTIADSLGRKRSRSHLFIGMESVPYETPDSIIRDAAYVFGVDFENQKIVSMK